jgi:hypothetical protein
MRWIGIDSGIAKRVRPRLTLSFGLGKNDVKSDDLEEKKGHNGE